MESPITYKNSPIIMSILQFRYNDIKDFDMSKVKKITDTISSDFPHYNERVTQNISIKQGEKINETSFSVDEKEINGVNLESINKKRVFVIEKNKFTFQSHEKYAGWDKFSGSFLNFWNKFKNVFEISELETISMRFVNKFDLPIDTVDLSTYFTTYLKDEKNTHKIRTFQFKFNAFDKETNITSYIGHSLEKPIGNNIPYILDIDLVLGEKTETSPEIIIQKLNKIRHFKNDFFNNNITDSTKKLIE